MGGREPLKKPTLVPGTKKEESLGYLGLEPRTYRLRADYSSIELVTPSAGSSFFSQDASGAEQPARAGFLKEQPFLFLGPSLGLVRNEPAVLPYGSNLLLKLEQP